LQSLVQTFQDYRTDKNPFKDTVPGKEITWLKPMLVAEIRFTEWTHEGRLRHPRYLGLRRDKKAKDVRKEEP